MQGYIPSKLQRTCLEFGEFIDEVNKLYPSGCEALVRCASATSVKHLAFVFLPEKEVPPSLSCPL